jgi:hypothetical protein
MHKWIVFHHGEGLGCFKVRPVSSAEYVIEAPNETIRIPMAACHDTYEEAVDEAREMLAHNLLFLHTNLNHCMDMLAQLGLPENQSALARLRAYADSLSPRETKKQESEKSFTWIKWVAIIVWGLWIGWTLRLIWLGWTS